LSLKFLEDLKCSPYIIKHSSAVLDKAQEISSNFDVDIDIICEGSLLHDVGRIKTQEIRHGIEGARILQEHGFPPEIVRIAEVHIGAGIPLKEAVQMGLPPRDFMPVTLEEKIVAHADNLIHGTREVTLEFVVSKWQKRMGKDHPSLERVKNLHEELLG